VNLSLWTEVSRIYLYIFYTLDFIPLLWTALKPCEVVRKEKIKYLRVKEREAKGQKEGGRCVVHLALTVKGILYRLITRDLTSFLAFYENFYFII
jgi:hypothetical protein